LGENVTGSVETLPFFDRLLVLTTYQHHTQLENLVAIENNEDRNNTSGGGSCNQIIVDVWVPQQNHGSAGAPKATDSAMQSVNWQQRGMHMAAEADSRGNEMPQAVSGRI
jgi:hypothetical protein